MSLLDKKNQNLLFWQVDLSLTKSKRIFNAQKMSLLDKNLLFWQLKTLSMPYQHLNRGSTILFKIQIAFNFAERKWYVIVYRTSFEAEKAPGMSQSLPDQSHTGSRSLWAVLAWVEVDCVQSWTNFEQERLHHGYHHGYQRPQKLWTFCEQISSCRLKTRKLPCKPASLLYYITYNIFLDIV